MDRRRGPSFFDWITDMIAIGIGLLAVLVVTHALGWWG
jgi:hypothetical protein